MKVDINNKSRAKLNLKRIQALVIFFTECYQLEFESLSIAIVGDKTMRGINKEYRGLDKPTDILSFEGEGNYMGELIIDLAQIK